MATMEYLKARPVGRQRGWGVCVAIVCVFLSFVYLGDVHAGPTTDLGTISTEGYTKVVMINNSNQEKWYRFDVDDAGRMTIYTEKMTYYTDPDTTGTLKSNSRQGTTIATDDNSADNDNFQIEAPLSSGTTYYLRVQGQGTYSLVFSFMISDTSDTSDTSDSSDTTDTSEEESYCMTIADSPLTTEIDSAPPLVMFLLDDSGSMDFDIMYDSDSGQFEYGNNGASSAYIQSDGSNIGLSVYADDVRHYWVTQSSAYNKVYYDPDVTYDPWPESDDDTILSGDASPDKAYAHPVFSYGSHDLDSETFVTIGSVNVRYAHYYVESGGTVYLVNFSGKGVYYYSVTKDPGDNKKISSLALVSAPDDIRVDDVTAALQNMANWYQYHRNRELAAKSAVAEVVSSVSGVKIGLHAINNGSVCTVQAINVDGIDLTKTLLSKLYNVNSSGGTGLRSALYEIGQYYDATDGATGGIGPSPYETDENGGSCQQAFTIVMTDGYYNGTFGSPNSVVGNTDEASDSDWDGCYFADGYSDTLADVAMRFYERDLSTDLDDDVPASDEDEAEHQHMVTYTVAFGVTGTLDPDDYDFPADCSTSIAWPNPMLSDKAKIDDLYHAAVNGRGAFLSAGSSKELVTSLMSLMEDIEARVVSGASVSLNSQELETDSALYQGYFDSSDWSGDLIAYGLSEDDSGTVTTTKVWSAKDVFEDQSTTWWDSGRKILTFNGSNGVAFRYDGLSTSQQALVTSDELDYIRGDTGNEESNGGSYRDRDGNMLGDIVDSSPVYEDGVVYVGANDGMLHAFDATDGAEIFSYVPSFVVKNLPELTDPDYSHLFYVNNTVSTSTVTCDDTSTIWLLGGLGKGGRGIYGIDITSPHAITETNIPTLWEYPASGTTDDDFGYTYSVPVIVEANTGENVILFGNGYDSANGHAVLYVLGLDGTLLTTIDTGSGSADASDAQCNGLSTPVPVDLDYNGTVDVVYAGDLLGHMWKFDLSGSTEASWEVAYGGNALFTAQNEDGEGQPIVSKPEVMTHCDSTVKGVQLLFGTGRYLAYGDISDTEIQSIYCIWDWADAWDEDERNGKYLGTFEASTDDSSERSFSNFTDATLLKQTAITGSDGYVSSSSNTISWFSPSEWTEANENGTPYTGGTHVGWHMDLPVSGERVVSKALLIDGVAVVVSIIPQSTPCSAGGGSVLYTLDACDGSALSEAFFDTDDDGDVDDEDTIHSGVQYENDIYYTPAVINTSDDDSDTLFLDSDEQAAISSEVLGVFYWRFVE